MSDLGNSRIMTAFKNYQKMTNALETESYPRHRWYFVKEGFSPELIKQAIRESGCQEGDLVVDVFCGGGTTTLTAVTEGRAALGFEVNPFLAFVSRSKLIQCRRSVFQKHSNTVLNAARTGLPSRLEGFSTFTEAGTSNKWLFNLEVLRAFQGGWKATNDLYWPARDLLRLCLIGAAMEVCNAVKDGKCLRYRKGWKERRFASRDFIRELEGRIAMVAEDLDECPIDGEYDIRNSDSRNLDAGVFKGKGFRLCVTSPPYLNSFDYTDIYRPELFLGRYVDSADELMQLRLRTLRSHVQANWPAPEKIEQSALLSQSLSEIDDHSERLWNQRIPDMIRAYFEDIKKILTSLKPLALPDATLWLVVSTSAYAGIEVPVDLILADIGSKCGWSLREIRVAANLRRVPGQQWDELSSNGNYDPYLRESIIILDNRRILKHYNMGGL